MLGHVQRGGTPSSRDRWLATRFGLHAIDAVAEEKWGMMTALRGTDIVMVPLAEATEGAQGRRPGALRRGRGLLRVARGPRSAPSRRCSSPPISPGIGGSSALRSIAPGSRDPWRRGPRSGDRQARHDPGRHRACPPPAGGSPPRGGRAQGRPAAARRGARRPHRRRRSPTPTSSGDARAAACARAGASAGVPDGSTRVGTPSSSAPAQTSRSTGPGAPPCRTTITGGSGRSFTAPPYGTPPARRP